MQEKCIHNYCQVGCHITSIKVLWFSKFHERKEVNGSNVQIHLSRRTSMKEHNECNKNNLCQAKGLYDPR